MSSSGQRVLSPCTARCASPAMRWLMAATSSRTTPRNRSRISGSTSGSASMSTAACMLASDERLPSVKPCSSWSRNGLFLEAAGDVVEHQHEAADVRGAVGRSLARLHRRHLHPQQLAGGRGRDELRRRAGRATRHPVADVVQRMRHQVAVEHGVDGTADAHQLRPAGHLRRLRQRLELQPGAAVVQQDAAVQVADHDALRQFGHQRGQPVALLFDAPAGLPHLRGHIGLQRAALARQLVDDTGQRPRLGAARGLDLARHLGRQQHAGLFGHPRGRGDPVPVGAAHQRAERTRQQQPGEQQQRAAGFEHRRERRALGRLERRGEQQPHADAPSARAGAPAPAWRSARAGRPSCDPRCRSVEAARHAAASSSRTRSASSRVENGLVT